MKKCNITTCALAALLYAGMTASLANGQETCRYSRMLESFEGVDFSANKIYKTVQNHVMTETNALLFRKSRDGGLINELAQTVEVDEAAKTMRITLNESCHWSDGEPITARDVVAGLRLTLSPEAAKFYIPGRNLLANASAILDGEMPIQKLGVRALNERDVEFDLIVPPDLLKSALTYAANTPAPTHLMEENPDIWPNPDLQPISSGPFYVQEHTKDRILLARNEAYCEGVTITNINRVEFLGVPGRRGEALLFGSGKVTTAIGLTVSQLEAIRRVKDEDSFRFVEVSNDVMGFITIADTSPLTQDQHLRRAILEAIDRERILEAIIGRGSFSRLQNSLNFEYSDYPGTTLPASFEAPIEERRKAAQQALSTAGYTPETPLELSLAYPPTAAMEQTAFALRSMLSPLGIQIAPVMEPNVFKRLEYDIALNMWGADYPDPENTLMGLSLLLINANPEEISAAVSQANMIFDHQERMNQLAKIETEMMAGDWLLPLFQVITPTVLQSSMTIGPEHNIFARNIYRNDCTP